MGIISAFKHEPTGKLFEKEADFKKYVKSYNKKQEKLSLEEKAKNDWIKLINEPRLTATSIEDFRLKVIKLWNQVNGKHGVQMTELCFENMTWKNKCSNSHSAPIGYKTNWCGYGDKDGIPRGYPGWRGRMKGKLSAWKSISSSELKENKDSFGQKIPGLNSGSGGGGENFEFELELFVYDFPLIYEKFKESLDKRDLIWKQYNIRKLEDETYLFKRQNFITNNEELKKVSNLMSETDTQINKLKEILKLQRSTFDCYHKDLLEQYSRENPYDFTILEQLKSQLEYDVQ